MSQNFFQNSKDNKLLHQRQTPSLQDAFRNTFPPQLMKKILYEKNIVCLMLREKQRRVVYSVDPAEAYRGAGVYGGRGEALGGQWRTTAPFFALFSIPW